MLGSSSWMPYATQEVKGTDDDDDDDDILWGKGGLCIGLTTLPPSCAECLGIWEPQPPGTLWACTWGALPFTVE
jgi:hypothetical protein